MSSHSCHTVADGQKELDGSMQKCLISFDFQKLTY